MPPSSRADTPEGSTSTRGAAIYPASLAQRRLWFLNELRAPTAAYNVNIGLWLYGPLDLEALQAAIQHIVNRHETLRTTFALQAGQLLQRIEPRYDVSLNVTDFSDLEQPYPPAYEFAKREVGEPFDLSHGPLFRVKILRIRTEEHVLLCTMHHTVTDAWSMQVFTRDLATLYKAIKNRTEAAFPELSIQYGDYACWQRDLLDTDFAKAQLSYWKRTLAGVPPLLQLPTDRPRPPEQDLEGSSHTFAVPGEIIAEVASRAGQQQVTTFMLLLAAFKVLLYRYSGQTDVCVGVPVAGRTRLETEPLIGFFVDTLVFRDDLSQNPRFVELLAAVRETTLSALANADVPFEKVVEILRPDRSLSYNPIFQVMFSVITSAIRSHSFGDVVAYPYVVDAHNSMLDLSATFIEDSDRKWWLEINFDTRLFDIERIRRMFEDYMDLLRNFIARPEMRINDVRIRSGTAIPGTQPIVGNREVTAASERSDLQPVSTPSDLSERELLTAIWKNVLGIEEVGVHDNFFDRGGHSLLAADLTAQIRQATGRKIPVSAIFRAPTIERLAALLHDDTANQSDPVLMQLGRGEDDIPFFAVAEPGAESLGFALLARNLSERHSVYKLQAAGTPVWERPLEKQEIRALAEQYVSAMRTVQPRGPYCLGGMCNGVLIAQEIIQLLESRGETVALFAILDTWVLENSQVKMLWAINYFKDRTQTFWRLPAGEQLALPWRVLKRMLTRDKRRTKWSQAYWPDDGFPAPRFAAPVLLFKRPRQPFYYVRDREMGWGKRSTGGVDVCEVNCGHFELLRLPHVALVAQKLSARLQEINQRAADGEFSLPAVPRQTPSGLDSSMAGSAA